MKNTNKKPVNLYQKRELISGLLQSRQGEKEEWTADYLFIMKKEKLLELYKKHVENEMDN